MWYFVWKSLMGKERPVRFKTERLRAGAPPGQGGLGAQKEEAAN